MAMLVVAGVTVKVAPDGARRQIREIGGDSSEAFDGGMRTTVRTRKFTLQITTKLLIEADRAALETALTATPTVACSGDLLGTTVTCIPQLTAVDPQWTKGGLRHRVTFTLFER